MIFIRIPKNASTSLYDCFGYYNIIHSRKEDIIKCEKALSWWQRFAHPSHINLELTVQFLGKEVLDLTKVCCVRNPYDRLVSAYEFTKKTELWRVFTDEEPTFTAFVKDYCKHKEDINYLHTHSQTRWISYEGKIQADVILRFESLKKDFTKFISDYGYSFELPHLNGTKHQDFQVYYDDYLKELVYESYKEDFENFGYNKLK